jgi:putative transposase
MAAKNSIKQYVDNSFYHLYNRGVEKQVIFRDEQDYRVFLSYLKVYLEPKDTYTLERIIGDDTAPWKAKSEALKLLRLNNFHDTLSLVSYCLMPNHFHFLIHQTEADTIDRFMNSLGSRYTRYLNNRYRRVGSLFQGVYKAVLIESEEQLFYVSRYIHRNPDPLRDLQDDVLEYFETYPYSSYDDFIGKRHTDWVKPEMILGAFSKSNSFSYANFAKQEQKGLYFPQFHLDAEAE